MNDEYNRHLEVQEAEILSQAPTQTYQGLNKAKKLARKQRDTYSLPKHIRLNKYGVQFGIGTLPSDDMNMVMRNEFGQEFERRIRERKDIEIELEKLAAFYQKNLKHNVYKTKAQAMRDLVTKNNLEKIQQNEQEHEFLLKNHIPKIITRK
jgi:hypothetical protein